MDQCFQTKRIYSTAPVCGFDSEWISSLNVPRNEIRLEIGRRIYKIRRNEHCLKSVSFGAPVERKVAVRNTGKACRLSPLQLYFLTSSKDPLCA